MSDQLHAIQITAKEWAKVVAELKALRSRVRLMEKRIKALEDKEREHAHDEWVENMGENL